MCFINPFDNCGQFSIGIGRSWWCRAIVPDTGHEAHWIQTVNKWLNLILNPNYFHLSLLSFWLKIYHKLCMALSS